ncbi:MAG: hypothetical protein CL678_02595 [Bdellovibrionaceae bacterium]|nr:hypothetical protein [Pseudobdellovibrionaceae bacterium]|tara:strand:+ start:3385 stop:3696 length:312 start_codon:yes stop_codon:yes gene_type:complete
MKKIWTLLTFISLISGGLLIAHEIGWAKDAEMTLSEMETESVVLSRELKEYQRQVLLYRDNPAREDEYRVAQHGVRSIVKQMDSMKRKIEKKRADSQRLPASH